ncbi:ABC-three component system protein [Polaromonas sp.]|uniref:ABC-three component system protein n=1 Tax=Polaromonas sp. TaxID=1869339 RepID=UPI003BA92003
MFNDQKNNTVGRDMAGRDLTNINNVTNNFGAPDRRTQIGFLYERLKSEVHEDNGLQEFVEELQHYMGRSTGGIHRSLSDKLTDSGRVDLVHVAEELKESAAKKIMRFQSSPAAQDIFAYVLGELHAKYLLLVRPLIAAGADRIAIDAAIEQHVVKPVADSMEPSALQMTPRLILALLFYLAGNCHIQWD